MRRTLLLFSFFFFFFGFANAQTDYPTRPIHFIVGPGPDSLARLFGQKMSEAWGQPVIVDQRGGGGGTISAEVVAKRSWKLRWWRAAMSPRYGRQATR